MGGYIAGIDLFNIGLFIAVFFIAIKNIKLALKSKLRISKILFLSSLFSAIMAIIFIALQSQWSYNNFGSNFADYTNLAWSLFETFNGVSLLLYGLGVSILLKWNMGLANLEQGASILPDNKQ